MSEIIAALCRFRRLKDRQVDAWCSYQPETKTLRFIAGVEQGLGRGVFSSMAGALTGEGMQILSADTDILADGLLMLRYQTTDLLYPEETPQERIEVICQALVDSVDSDQPPRFRKQWGEEEAEASIRLTSLPNEVKIDNGSSDQCTLVEVFTFDRTGLLYKLARKLHDLLLVIQHAKIGTYLDQVVDVFYVTDRDGRKISDPKQLEYIRAQMFEVIDA